MEQLRTDLASGNFGIEVELTNGDRFYCCGLSVFEDAADREEAY